MTNKYHVSPRVARTYDGIVFDSKAEMHYYRDVVLAGLESGDIVSCERQKVYELQPKYVNKAGNTVRAIKYVCDFYLVYDSGMTEVIDIKGMATAEALLKRKIFEYKYPDENLRWLCERAHGWKDYE